MAYEEAVRSITLKADSSLAVYTGVPGLAGSASPNSGNQYRFVKATTTAGTCTLATAAANELVLGVLQNKPQNTNMAATVAISGVSKVEAGTGGVTAGAAVKVEADGQAVVATLPGDAAVVVGVALAAASAGQLFPCLLRVNGA